MSHPDSKQLANFHAAVQTMKLYRRAEIEDARGESLIEELYVDPLPHDHVLETMLRPSTTFLIGRKGSGKSTVFQRVQHKLAKDRRAASAYVDIKTVFESARVDPQLVRKIDSEGSALNAGRVHELLLMRTFIKATVRGIRDGLSRQSVSWIQRMKDSFTGSTAELFADLDDYLDRINRASFVDVTGLTKVSSSLEDSRQNAASSKAGISVGKEGLPTRDELAVPSQGDTAHGAGADDPVVRGVLWPAVGAVTGSEMGMTANAGQPSAGGVDDFWVDVDGKDIVVTEAMGQQGGVVAGARPDLQDSLTFADVEGSSMCTIRSGLVDDDTGTKLPYLLGTTAVTNVLVE